MKGTKDVPPTKLYYITDRIRNQWPPAKILIKIPDMHYLSLITNLKLITLPVKTLCTFYLEDF